MPTHDVRVESLPEWLDASRLLGPGAWTVDPGAPGAWVAALERRDAADLAARLRGVGVGGRALSVSVTPALPRAAVRAARTEDARRRRSGTVGFERRGARLDDEGRWSLTPEAIALRMADAWSLPRVVDAGCGVGGNAIAFARRGASVVAIERDPDRLAMARHNAGVYGVAEQIEFRQADAASVLPGLLSGAPATLVFVDPPWGTEWNRTRTTRADLPGLDAIVDAAKDAQEIVVKVPPSFDPAEYPQGRAKAWFGEAEGDRRRIKFVTVALSRRRASP